MARALLYLPDSAGRSLACRLLAGRPLAARALVAALRAGATLIGVPSVLRDPGLERAVARMPPLARAVRWIDPAGPAGREPFQGEPWLLVPASALVDARTLAAVLGSPPGAGGAVLGASAASGAPVLLAPGALVGTLWGRLAAGQPVGAELARHIESARPDRRDGRGVFAAIRDERDLREAEALLYRRVGTGWDTGVDRFLHRRCSRQVTRLLVLTPATPNQVSVASLAVGGAAIWCVWGATPWSAAWGVALYALASILDHCDGEIARLTFQESRFGAHLDWLIDTVIHSGVVLGMAVTAGGPVMTAVGIAAAAGVTLSAWFARILPHEIEVGETLGGALKNMGNRDFFYILLLAFVLFRWTAPALLAPLALLVAAGSQAYWLGCVARLRRGPAAGPE